MRAGLSREELLAPLLVIFLLTPTKKPWDCCLGYEVRRMWKPNICVGMDRDARGGIKHQMCRDKDSLGS